MLFVVTLIALLVLIYLMNINDNLDKILKELIEHARILKNMEPKKGGEQK